MTRRAQMARNMTKSEDAPAEELVTEEPVVEEPAAEEPAADASDE